MEAARLSKRIDALTKQRCPGNDVKYWTEQVSVIRHNCILTGVIIPRIAATIFDILFNKACDNSEKISTYFLLKK